MAHLFPRWCRGTRDVANHGLGNVALDKLGGGLFVGTTNFTNENDASRGRIGLEELKAINEIYAADRITTNSNTGGLS